MKILADEYKEGLNIDNVKYNPIRECSVGGLYFTDIIKACMYFHFGNKFSYVTIPDEALVYIEKDKFKANMFILANILPLTELCIQGIQLCKLAVQHNGLSLELIREQTEEICQLAV